ncbi:RING finger protein 141-like, partial [Stegodyphus dumicola]|uniref:RING finger protein 141-like n=1 Tax=Stegodyphus dumicola TaxID=202533 RepID=UPI0015B0E33C
FAQVLGILPSVIMCVAYMPGWLIYLKLRCCRTVDCNGRTLLFVIKCGSDSTILWKQTVQIACVRVIKETKKVEDYKVLNLKQFLQAYKMILYHISCISGMETGADDEASSSSEGELKSETLRRNPISTSMILNQIGSAETATDLDECIVCMERKPEVTLPCAHSYCLFCIEQWNVSNKTCPVCRETLENTDDSWVIPEIPESSEVAEELQKAMTALTTSTDKEWKI